MSAPVRILYLEDDPLDVRIVEDTLREAGLDVRILAVDDRSAFLAALDRGGFDLILADFALPGFTGLDALSLARELRPGTPFVFFTGALGEERAVETLRNGATDFVLKSRLPRLAPALRRALAEADERARRVQAETERQLEHDRLRVTLQALRESEAQLRQLNESLDRQVAQRTEDVQRLAEHLRELTTELTQAEQRERKRIAAVLHDHIQQLLVAARMQLGMGQRLEAEPVRLRESVSRAEQYIGEALDASRSLTAELSPPVLHQAGLAAALVWLAERTRTRHGFVVHLDGAGFEEPCDEDVRLFLFDAVSEVVFNACKYAGVAQARVRVTSGAGEIEVLVEDEGRGFDPEALRKQHRPESGGFGLFSIQQRLSYLGGKLEIDSAPGQGTRVRLRAPLGKVRPSDLAVPDILVRGRGAPAGLPPQDPGHAAGRIRVLVVDDHKVLREGLRSALRIEPDLCVVGEAEDGAQAVELAAQLQPDVILMDVSMPRMGGIDATRAICRQLPHARVIGLSMHADATSVQSLRAAGAVGCLAKTEPIEAVLAAIRSALPSAPPGSAAAPAGEVLVDDRDGDQRERGQAHEVEERLVLL